MSARTLLIVTALVSATAPASAQPPRPAQNEPPSPEGAYNVKFDEVSNNCSGTGINLTQATVTVDKVKGRSISVTIPMVPILRGAVRQGGKFRAKAKKGKTAIQGVEGRFSAGGRIDDTSLQFVFIAEYFRGSDPLCTQSWNASGTK